MPEDIRAEKSFEPFATVKDQPEFIQKMARSYHGAQGLIGKKGLQIPTETSTAEERAAFNKALGVPDKPDDYKFDVPEGAKLDEGRIANWRKELHAAGVPAAAANKIVGAYLKEESAAMATHTAKLAKWENEAKAHFGQDIDKTLNHVNYALRELDKDGEVFKLLDSTGLGNHKSVLAMLGNIGQMLGERGPRGAVSAAAGALSADQAQVEIAQFERTHREALFDARHVDHDFAVKRRGELYAAAFPKV